MNDFEAKVSEFVEQAAQQAVTAAPVATPAIVPEVATTTTLTESTGMPGWLRYLLTMFGGFGIGVGVTAAFNHWILPKIQENRMAKRLAKEALKAAKAQQAQQAAVPQQAAAPQPAQAAQPTQQAVPQDPVYVNPTI